MSTFPTGQYNFIYYDESPSSEGKEAAAPYMKWKSASKPHLLVFASTDGSHSGVASREIARHGKVMTSPNADVSRDSTQFVGAAITNCDKPDAPITAAVCGPAWVTNNSDECLLELDRVDAVAPYPTTEVGESFLVRRHKRPPQHELLRETVFPIGIVLCSANKRARATVLLRRPTSRAIETACIKRGLLRSPSIPLAVFVAEARNVLLPPLIAAANAAEAEAGANLRATRDAHNRTHAAQASVVVIRARVEEATNRFSLLRQRLTDKKRETNGTAPCAVYTAVRKKLVARWKAGVPLLDNVCIHPFTRIDNACTNSVAYLAEARRAYATLGNAVRVVMAQGTVADVQENKEHAVRYALTVHHWMQYSTAARDTAETAANDVIAHEADVQTAIDAVFNDTELAACVAALDAEDIALAGVAATAAMATMASCMADLQVLEARIDAARAGFDAVDANLVFVYQTVDDLGYHLKTQRVAAAGSPHATLWGLAEDAFIVHHAVYVAVVGVVTSSADRPRALDCVRRVRVLLDEASVINTDVQNKARARVIGLVTDEQRWERFTKETTTTVRRFADEAMPLVDNAEHAFEAFNAKAVDVYTAFTNIIDDVNITAATSVAVLPPAPMQLRANVTTATEAETRAKATARAATAQATAAKQTAALPQALAAIRAEATARVMAAAQTAAEVVARAAAAEQTTAETRATDAQAVLAQATADAARALTDAPAAAAAAAVAVNSYNDATTQAAATAARADASAQALAVARAAEAAADATDVVAFAVVQRATAAAQAAADACKVAADTAAAAVTHAFADVQATAATQASTATAHADAEARVMAAQAALTQATADTRAAETARAEATTQAMAAQTAATAARALVAPAVVAAAPAPAAAAAVAAAPAPAIGAGSASATGSPVSDPSAVAISGAVGVPPASAPTASSTASPTGVSTGTPTAANTRGGVAKKKRGTRD